MTSRMGREVTRGGRAAAAPPGRVGAWSRACGRSSASATGSANRWRVMALARANSRRPSAPWIRPKPDSPTPPNGSAGANAKAHTALMLVMPHCRRSAMSWPRRRERVKTAEPRPYDEALARATASSSSRTRAIVTVGPKVSSSTASDSSGTSTRTTGWACPARTESRPPTTAWPPRSSASSTWRSDDVELGREGRGAVGRAEVGARVEGQGLRLDQRRSARRPPRGRRRPARRPGRSGRRWTSPRRRSRRRPPAGRRRRRR